VGSRVASAVREPGGAVVERIAFASDGDAFAAGAREVSPSSRVTRRADPRPLRRAGRLDRLTDTDRTSANAGAKFDLCRSTEIGAEGRNLYPDLWEQDPNLGHHQFVYVVYIGEISAPQIRISDLIRECGID